MHARGYRPSRPVTARPRGAYVAATLYAALAYASPALAEPDDDGDEAPGKPATEITVTARRLDAARASIEPALGASTYTLSNDTIEARPGGETTTINAILLQTPGVAQDGAGQLRLRQSQGKLQYRINNVLLPEGLADPGESLSARIAAKVEVMTGALPAQYGLTGGGVVNVTTKDGVYLNGGQAELYGGSHAQIQPAFEYGGSAGATNFFATASYQRANNGEASPDGSANPLHDRTRQLEVFSYAEHVVNPQTRLSMIVGASDEKFELPNRRGLDAATVDLGPVAFLRPLTVNGISNFTSEARDDRSRKLNLYGVVSLLHTTDEVTLQISGFTGYAKSTLDAAGTGDILFTGAGRSTAESRTSLGIQAEGLIKLGKADTLRAGLVVMSDVTKGRSLTLAVPVDNIGRQLGETLVRFTDTSRLESGKDSLFLQDEWQLTHAITINLGGRVDHVTAPLAGTRFSPRASLVWKPLAETTFHLGYARYFLPAPVEAATERPTELAGTSAGLPTATGNPARPELDDYYDAGVQYEDGGLTAAVDAYWRMASNAIEEGRFGAANQLVTFNYRQERDRGIEFSLTYRSDRLSAWANVAVGDARGRGIASNQYYFSASELGYVAGHWIATSGTQAVTASGGVSYRFDRLRLSADLLAGSGAVRTAPGGSLNASHLPFYVQVNLSAVYRLARFDHRTLDLRLDVINLADRAYRLNDGTALGGGQAQWGARRAILAGIEQAF